MIETSARPPCAILVIGGFDHRVPHRANRRPAGFQPRIDGAPLVIHQMRALAREGLTDGVVIDDHQDQTAHTAIQAEAARLGLTLRILVQDQALGTAGCLSGLDRATAGRDSLIIHGPVLFDISLPPLIAAHRARRAVLTIVSHPDPHPDRCDLIVADDQGRVSAIRPWDGRGTDEHRRNRTPTGLYLADRAFLSGLAPQHPADLLTQTVPALIGGGQTIAAYTTPEYVRTVSTQDQQAAAEQDVQAGRLAARHLSRRRPAVFFDCDGVLNREPGGHGVTSPSQIELIPGAGAALRRVQEAGLFTVVVTNRGQMAKGLISRDDLDGIFGRVETLLAADGGLIDRIYFCPHHPGKGFDGGIPSLRQPCECRKPGTLMLRQAMADLPIEPAGSVMIGDSLRDIGAARAAGLVAYGVRTGHGCRDAHAYPAAAGPLPQPDVMFDSVVEAVTFALDGRRPGPAEDSAVSTAKPATASNTIIADHPDHA